MRLVEKLEEWLQPLFWSANQPMAAVVLPPLFVRVVIPGALIVVLVAVL